jgi:hypothetical protein
MDYWITEYKIDGYRIDLAKGFTQTQSTTTTVENFDGSRVDNLFRYYDYIVPKYPGTYMILEFLGQQRQEEQLYASHGFLLWGNNNATYNQIRWDMLTIPTYQRSYTTAARRLSPPRPKWAIWKAMTKKG